MSKTGKYWLMAFFYAVLFMVVYGYQFNTSDQEEHLPQVYKLLNPGLYQGDYVVSDLLNNFGIRFFYVKVVYALAHVMPVSTACFILQLTLLAVFCFYLLRLVFLFFKSDAAAYVAPLFCFVMLNRYTVGGNAISDSMLTCSMFANAACLAALYYFFAGRKMLPYGLAGLATLFQLLMGLHIFLLMASVQLVTLFTSRGVFYTLRGAGIYLVTAGCMLVPVFARQFLSHDVNSELYYYVLYVFRNPHHYLPSFFATSDYFKTCMQLALAAISILVVNPRFRKMLVVFLALIVVSMLFYYFAFEVLGIQAIGKLQWFKTSTWLTLFCGIAISGWIVRFKKLHRYIANKYSPFVAGALALVLLYGITHSKKIPVAALQDRYQVGDYNKTDLTLMHEWINKNTPVDARMISFPMDESFLCEAQRPMPVAWKAIIHEPWFMTRWYTDFILCYHMKDVVKWQRTDVKEIATESYGTFNNNRFFKMIGVKYRLDDTATCKLNDLGKVVHVEGRYMLTEIN